MSTKKVKEEKDKSTTIPKYKEETKGKSMENASHTETESLDATASVEPNLTEELNLWKDKYTRLYAEFDNYRKRTIKEKLESFAGGKVDVMKGIIPLFDDFDRAIKASETTESVEALKGGLLLINNKVTEFLSKHGISEIKALEEVFNPELHDAIAQIPAPSEDMKGKVLDVVEKGYMINESTIIRFAKVVVGC